MANPPASDSFPFGQPIVWQPDPQAMANSNLRRFMDRHLLAEYADLLEWARQDVGRFWSAVLDDLGIEFSTPYSQIVDLSNGIERPAWCVNGRMNIIHNCLDKWQRGPARERIAIRYESEEGDVQTLTYAQLHEEANHCAAALRQLGLGKGDAVGLFMPMMPELVIAFLAVIKIGGIVLPLFSGYGPAPIIARLLDAQAKAVITADGMVRRGKLSPMKPVLDEALTSVPTVEKVVVVKRTGNEIGWQAGRDVWWEELIGVQEGERASSETADTSAEDVLMLIYTSGTTGRPKGAVHTHCGFPIKNAQDMRHCMDVKAGDTFYWMTDIGWMMGPWLIFGTLLNGAAMLLYDGAPDYPNVERTWSLVERHQVTHLGLSPVMIRALRPFGLEPVAKHELSSLRMVCSTGSPWDPESWMWLFDQVLKRKIPIINYSGGTEVSGGILCGNLFTPLKPCSLGGPMPGMDVDVVDESGQSVRNAVGELVIRQPWIGITRGFWGNDLRYHDTYWSRIPGMWVHGDFAAIDEDGLWYILGRSDDTIKVAGKRLGPAEVESILNAHPAVVESAAIGVPHPIKDNEVVAYCVLRNGYEPSEVLRSELMANVAKELGKSLRPKEIKFTTALPKTRNAKVMHRVIRATYLGQTMGDLSSLENIGTVEAIKDAV
ncbi:MAG: AMP-binding protein [Caldilineaceae bacterium]